MVKQMLARIYEEGFIRSLDLAFAEFIAEQEAAHVESVSLNVALLAAHLSQRLGEQDSCIKLCELKQVFQGIHRFPDVATLKKMLLQASSVACIEQDDEATSRPLVLLNEHLYLQRYWQYEKNLAAIIREKSSIILKIDYNVARDLVDVLFPDNGNYVGSSKIYDWQKIAVSASANKLFSMITGGPGTGKTTTVTRLMALLNGLAVAKNERCLIKLVAPTGKAAARLSESILGARKKLPAQLQQALPSKCSTIHRLLGAKPFSPYFKHDANNPLDLDVLVLDEASMVDLPLMAKLFAAVPLHARVVLLGDQDQLASVEAGSVLSDMCASAMSFEQHHGVTDYSQASYSRAFCEQINRLCDYSLPASEDESRGLEDNLVILKKSHRFSDESSIGQLAKAIKLGALKACIELLSDKQAKDISWLSESEPRELIAKLLPAYQEYLAAVNLGDIQAAFACLHVQQVLCAQRSGEWGVLNLNRLIEQELNKQGLVDISHDFYIGRPIMLMQNDHQHNLFNGDVGIVATDPENQQLTKVWFVGADGELRGLLPSRLPPHETLYAMTIHKSQGSEFNHVHLCIGQAENGNIQTRGLSRELLYTGLTRAKINFSLYASQKAVQSCLQQQCKRGSGLSERLLKMNAIK